MIVIALLLPFLAVFLLMRYYFSKSVAKRVDDFLFKSNSSSFIPISQRFNEIYGSLPLGFTIYDAQFAEKYGSPFPEMEPQYYLSLCEEKERNLIFRNSTDWTVINFNETIVLRRKGTDLETELFPYYSECLQNKDIERTYNIVRVYQSD